MKILFLYIGIFITSFILTYLVKLIAQKKMIVDVPNNRSSHEIPIPRGGGLAIILAWFLGLGFLFFFNQLDQNLFFGLLSGILISIISFLDDIYTLKALPRIIVQIITASLALYFISGLTEIDLGFTVIQNQIVLNILAFVGIIWFINLFNFIDGINGYSSGGGIFIALAIFFFTSDKLLLVFIASILGFLPWNWGKAKIFMGDIGSTVLGFTIALFLIHYHNTRELSIINGLVLTSVYWFDATFTLIKRFLNKEKLILPHNKHAYQRAVQAGLSHQTTSLIVLLINLLLFGLVYLSKLTDINPLITLCVAVLLLFIIYKIVEIKKPFE